LIQDRSRTGSGRLRFIFGNCSGSLREKPSFLREFFGKCSGKPYVSSGSVRENAHFVREFFGEASAAAEGFPNRSGSLAAAH